LGSNSIPSLLTVDNLSPQLGHSKLEVIDLGLTVLTDIIKELEKISEKKYEDNKERFRIIADHVRGAVFLISDNVLPSNVEEGYILRRILRAVFGGGADISAANPLPVTSETSMDNGIATGGTADALIDTTRGWQVNIWEDAIVEILDVSTGISYTREL